VEDIEFINDQQARECTTQMHANTKHINHSTIGFSCDYFEIIAPFACMCWVHLPSPSICEGSFKKLSFWSRSTAHPNRWIILFVFDKFFRLVKIKPIVNVFRTCYHLVIGTNNGNDMCWFFIFF